MGSDSKMVSGLHVLRHFRALSVGFLRLFDGGLHWQAPAVELILSKKKFRGVRIAYDQVGISRSGG